MMRIRSPRSNRNTTFVRPRDRSCSSSRLWRVPSCSLYLASIATATLSASESEIQAALFVLRPLKITAIEVASNPGLSTPPSRVTLHSFDRNASE